MPPGETPVTPFALRRDKMYAYWIAVNYRGFSIYVQRYPATMGRRGGGNL